MKNIKRHKDYITISQRIRACETPEQLEVLRQLVLKYKNIHSDGPELMALFLEKEQDLSVEYKNEREFERRNHWRDLDCDSMESLYHEQKRGARL